MSAIEKWRKLPLSWMAFHIFGKFLFGIGIGALLASYLQEYDWVTYGCWPNNCNCIIDANIGCL